MKILQVFNRYLRPGGEEKSVDRIHRHLSLEHEVFQCLFDSREWTQSGRPGVLRQIRNLFSNPDSARRFEGSVTGSGAQVAMFHNIYPVGSPILYKVALRQRLPVIQYLHNFRPFSVGGTLYARQQLLTESLQGDFRREVCFGSWQGSVAKSLLFALMLKRLHRSGWLDSVHAWVAISEFIRDKFIDAGIPPEKIHTLRHSWDAMPDPPTPEDSGAYLFLGRLVEEKGVLTLLLAWEELHRQLGSRTPILHIAGEGPLECLIREKARYLPSIRFRGLLAGSEKAEALRTCRAVIVPSTWWEPLGLVVYEAYDSSKPVLAARSGGLSETVHVGLTGLLHDPGSASALACDVITMESMPPDARLGMGKAGRTWLLQDACLSRWQKKLNQILYAIEPVKAIV